MKTVLMICPFSKPNIGGVESHIEKLISYLSKNSCKVVLVTYQPLTTNASGLSYEKTGDVEIYRVSWFGRGWFTKLEPYFPLVFLYLFPGLFLKSFFIFLSRRKEIDVIHAHGFVAAAVSKILLMFSRKRSVVSTHAIYKLGNRKLLASIIKWLLKGFDTVLAVGEPSRKELIEIGLDEKKIKVHPNWIDINLFTQLDRDECRKAFGLAHNDFTVLFLGRLMEMKGVLVLLEAAKRTGKNIKFVFAGDGPLSEEVKKAASSNGKVSYLGRLPDKAILAAYNAADLFVSPVLYEEGFATVYLESLSCGTPVISANRGCLPYFLRSEVADLLDVVDADSVKRTLEYYFDNRESLAEKRKICRKYAEENFSENNAAVILNSY